MLGAFQENFCQKEIIKFIIVINFARNNRNEIAGPLNELFFGIPSQLDDTSPIIDNNFFLHL